MIKNILEKIFSFLDKRQNIFALIALAITITSEILYIFFHTYEYGYFSTIEENIPQAVFVPLIMIITFSLVKNSKLNKRFVTYVYCVFFLISIIQFSGALHCIFIGDLSPIQAALLSLPLIISLILLCIYFLKQAKESIKMLWQWIKAVFKKYWIYMVVLCRRLRYAIVWVALNIISYLELFFYFYCQLSIVS